MAAKKKQAVVVTTAHRGIFVGYTTQPLTADPIELTDARMVVYFDQTTRGALGISSKGVGSRSRISPTVPRIVLRNVTSVAEASADAVKAWEAEPWS